MNELPYRMAATGANQTIPFLFRSGTAQLSQSAKQSVDCPFNPRRLDTRRNQIVVDLIEKRPKDSFRACEIRCRREKCCPAGPVLAAHNAPARHRAHGYVPRYHLRIAFTNKGVDQEKQIRINNQKPYNARQYVCTDGHVKEFPQRLDSDSRNRGVGDQTWGEPLHPVPDDQYQVRLENWPAPVS